MNMIHENDQPEADIHDLPDRAIVEEYEELMMIMRHGDPDNVTPRQKRRYKRLQAELISRVSKEVLGVETANE